MSTKLIEKRQKKKLYRKRRFVYFVIIPIVILASLYFYLQRHYLINTTDSMPIGLYEKYPIKNIDIGNVVSVCLDDKKADLAIKHHIISFNHQCANGSQMLIKEVIAIPNDDVELTKNKIKDHHGLVTYNYPAPRFSFAPTTHKPVLTFIDTGKYKSTGYWLYGRYDSTNSWDSRYFGEVSKQNIINILKPIWIWS